MRLVRRGRGSVSLDNLNLLSLTRSARCNMLLDKLALALHGSVGDVNLKLLYLLVAKDSGGLRHGYRLDDVRRVHGDMLLRYLNLLYLLHYLLLSVCGLYEADALGMNSRQMELEGSLCGVIPGKKQGDFERPFRPLKDKILYLL